MTFTSATATATAAASSATQNQTNTTATAATTTATTKTMEQDLFQFFDSLSQPSPVGEWYQEFSSMAPASTHTSPEIATPLDIHLSPSASKAEPPHSCVGGTFGTTMGISGVADLDMSEILNSPIFDSPVATMTPMMTPATPHADMFSDMGQHDLPSALAAFVAAVSSSGSSPATTFASPSLPVTGITSVQDMESSSSLVSPSTITRKRSSPDEPAADELPLDEAALKRRKNTDAARRSRLKKVMNMEAFEKRVNDLERMNAQLLLRVAVLDSEKSHLQSKEAVHDSRVQTLEAQLAEAHKALASRSM
ncbi:unnamed protein product [Absidia cylindrospora]